MAAHDSDTATAREDLCRFLAACYYEPGPEFSEERVFDSLLDAAGRVDAGLAAGARRLGEAFATADLESLLVDYTRLFLGPVDAPARPYGSVWLVKDGLPMQDATMEVVGLYQEGGFDVSDDFRELPDHVAAELEFLYLLLFREHRARRDGDATALARYQNLRRRFLEEHLGRWAGPFTDAVRAGARSAFYRELGELTARAVALEVQRATQG